MSMKVPAGKWFLLGNDFLLIHWKEISWQMAHNDLKLMIYSCSNLLPDSDVLPQFDTFGKTSRGKTQPAGGESSTVLRRALGGKYKHSKDDRDSRIRIKIHQS